MRLLFTLVLICSSITLLGALNRPEYKKAILESTQSIKGWCSAEKRRALIDHVFKTKPEVSVEIGVYGGKSLIPIAAALKFNGRGVIYGIDPWSLDECTKNYSSDHIVTKIWEKQDLEGLYQNVMELVDAYSVADHCRILRMTSAEAAGQFDTIDFLHIDGNHSEESTLNDVQMYLGKVKRGGYICLDDCQRETTRKAYDFVREKCKVVKTIDNGNSQILRKIK